MSNEIIEIANELGIELDYYEQTTSTNDLARDLHYSPGAVIFAERQTSGRGQRGNSWESPPGVNLTFSVVLQPDFLPADQQFYISRMIALSLTDTIASIGLSPRIKWPNDIYIGDRKTAGILIENDLMGTSISRTIAGIGLNVNQLEFDPSIPNPTSLAIEVGANFDRGMVFKRFYMLLAQRYEEMAGGYFERMDSDYLGRLYRRDEEHLFLEEGSEQPFAGTILGVAPGGELQIRHTSTGKEHSYLFKEVEYIL